MASGLNELKETIVLACRILDRLGLVDYLGHVSARVPGSEHLLVSPRGHAVGGLQSFGPDDLLVIDADGRRLEGVHPVPSEVYIHTEVLRARSDVQSVVHTHQAMAVAFSIAGRPILPVHIVGAELFEQPVPTHDNPNLVNTPAKGREMAVALGRHRLLLLRGHGIISAGASVEEAVLNAIFLEQQAWHHYRAAHLDDVRTLTTEEIQTHLADLEWARRTGGAGGAWRYYTSLLGASVSPPRSV